MGIVGYRGAGGSVQIGGRAGVSSSLNHKPKKCNTLFFLFQMLIEGVNDKTIKATVFLFSEGF